MRLLYVERRTYVCGARNAARYILYRSFTNELMVRIFFFHMLHKLKDYVFL